MFSSQHYRVIVEGELGPRYASAFEGMAISAHDGITEMTGSIVDSSHLQGLLERIAGLGLKLRLVALDPDGAVPATGTQQRGSPPS